MDKPPSSGENRWHKVPVVGKIIEKVDAHKERLRKQILELERIEKVRTALYHHGLSYYVRNTSRSERDISKEEKTLIAWCEILSTEAGLALLDRYEAVGKVTNPDAERIKDRYESDEEVVLSEVFGSFNSYYMRQWLQDPVLSEPPSLSRLECFLKLALLTRGRDEYPKFSLINAYLKSEYLRSGVTEEKLNELLAIVARVEKVRGAFYEPSAAYRIFENWFTAPNQRDLSLETISAFCVQLEEGAKEERDTDARREAEGRRSNNHFWTFGQYLPSMFSSSVSPEAVPPNEILPFLDDVCALSNGASEKINQVPVVQGLLPHLARLPNGGKPLRIEQVKRIIDFLTTIPNLNPGNCNALIYSVYQFEKNGNMEGVTVDTWPETIGARYAELAEASGRASRSVFGGLGLFTRFFDFKREWAGFVGFVRQHIKGSELTVDTLALAKDLPKEHMPILKSVLRLRPSALASTVELLSTASLLGVKLKPEYIEMLSPIPDYSKETLDSIVERFKGLQRKNGRSEKSRDKGIKKLVGNLQAAIGRNDIEARDALTKEITDRFGIEYQEYFESLFPRLFARKARQEFKAEKLIPERLNDEAFLKAYAMYKRLLADDRYHARDTDLALARELIGSYLSGKPDFAQSLPQNQEWLKKTLGERSSLWLSENIVEFPTGDAPLLKDNIQGRQKQFLKQAVPLFERLRPAQSSVDFSTLTAQGAIDYFSTLSPAGYSEEQSAAYEDLQAQIRGLEQSFIDAYGGERPEKVRIMRETDSSEALMLGSRVSGSCYDVAGMNYWVSFPNALELNKGVYWITNEQGKVLGRVLLAITNDRKLVRFPVYYAGVGIDLNPYVDSYVRDLAAKLGLDYTGGETRNIERLLWSQWSSDSPQKVKEP